MNKTGPITPNLNTACFFVRICVINYDMKGGGTMYYIMNKDRIIAELDYINNEIGTAVPQLVAGSLPEVYGDMKLKSWLETRYIAKR